MQSGQNENDRADSHPDEDERTLDAGNSQIDDLIGVLKDVVRDYDMMAGFLGKSGGRKNVIEVAIDKYQRLLKATSFDDHRPFFIDCYKRNRNDILKSYEDGSWIERDVHIWYGEDIAKVKSRNIKLPISTVFSRAISIDEKARNEKEDVQTDKSDENVSSSHDVPLYTDEIYYYTLRIFETAIENHPIFHKDVKALQKTISKFSQSLNLDENAGKRRTTNNPYGSLVKAIGEIAGSAGGASEGKNNSFDSGQFSKMIQSVIGDKDIQNTLNNVFSNVGQISNQNNPQDIGKFVSNVFSSISPAVSKKFSDMASQEPPDGVHDGRTAEQKLQDVEMMKKNLSNMEKTIGSIATQLSAGEGKDT